MEDTWASNRDNGPLQFHVQENILDLSERVYTIELSVMSCFTYLERFFKWQCLEQMLGKVGQKKPLSFKPHPLTWLIGHMAIMMITNNLFLALPWHLAWRWSISHALQTQPSLYAQPKATPFVHLKIHQRLTCFPSPILNHISFV